MDSRIKIKSVLGFDVHPFETEREKELYLCGIKIPYKLGLKGHSDGDVGLHALIDALLSAFNLPDIGSVFPDKDPRFKDISSSILLEKTLEIIKGLKIPFEINFVDFTFICDEPKLFPFYEGMIKKIAELLQVSPDKIHIKARTTEGMLFTQKGIACFCLLTLEFLF